MSWAHRADGLAGVEGWLDAGLARAWAQRAQTLFARARNASTLAESKAVLRDAAASLDQATAALNLPQSQGSADLLTRAFPFGVDRVELDAAPSDKAAAQRAAVAHFGSTERVRDWALAQPLGRYAFDGFAVRVFDGLEGEKSYSVQAPDAAVLAWRRAAPPSTLEQRAADIVADPWAAYVARRREIDATNAQRAAWWGLTSPEEVAGFQIASDAVNNALAQEWTNNQRERVRAKYNEITDTIANVAASSVVGAPIALVFKALQLLGGILPWVTEEPPPPAVSRVRSGGISDAPRDRPTHTVPQLPALESDVIDGPRPAWLGVSKSPSSSSSSSTAPPTVPVGRLSLTPTEGAAILRAQAGARSSSSSAITSTPAPMAPSSSSPSSSSSSSSSTPAASLSPATVVAGALLVAGALYLWRSKR